MKKSSISSYFEGTFVNTSSNCIITLSHIFIVKLKRNFEPFVLLIGNNSKIKLVKS